MNNELDFDSILSEIHNDLSVLEIGNFRIRELTLEQQRKILNNSVDPATMPAKISNLYNSFVDSKVEYLEDIAPVVEHTTVDKKPYLLAAIRILSLGDTIKVGEKEYKLSKPTPEDFSSEAPSTSIKFGNIVLDLATPTIAEDTYYNERLIASLSGSKKRIQGEEDVIKMADSYQIYELMKFIKTIHFKDTDYNFINVADSDRLKFVNQLPQKIANDIVDFIQRGKASEERAFSAISEDGEQRVVDGLTIFFAEPSFIARD